MFNFALLRYGISGFSAGVIHLGLLYVLVDYFGYHYLLASTVAVSLAVIVSFTLQKFWTFKNEDLNGVHVQFFYYAIIAIADIILNAALLYVLVEMVGLHYMVAQVIVMGAIAAASFLFYSLIFAIRGAKEKRMGRVLIATGLYPPETGGPATYAKIIEEELPRHGIPVEVFAFRNVRLFPRIIRHFIYFFEILQRATRADTIFALDPVSVGFPSLIAAKMLEKKFIVKVVGDYAWEQYVQTSGFITPEEFQKKRFDFITELRRTIEHLVARRADTVIVPSEYLKKIVMMWGVLEEKIIVIYNAFESASAEEDRETIRRRLLWDGYIIISAGRLVPWKGFDALIELMPEVNKKIPHAKLVIAGSGPEEERLKAKSRKLKASVVFTGNVSHDELLSYLKAADLCVLNTGYEGLSHLLLEAMAAGVPIITTSVGGNPELIESGKTGLLVAYNDKEALGSALLSIFNDPQHGETLSKNAKDYVKRFSRGEMIKATKRALSPF